MNRFQIGTVCLALLISYSLTMPAKSQAQDLENLFTTVEERNYLDQLRRDFLEKSKEQDFDIAQGGPPPIVFDDGSAPIVVEFKLNGIVTQHNGSHTIWLNNATLAENELPDNMKLITSNGNLALQIDSQEGSFILKTGQSINLSSGILQEAYQVQKNELMPEAESEVEPNNSLIENPSPTPALNDSIPETISELTQALQIMEESLSEE